MLDESVNNLKRVATSGMEGVKKHVEVIDVAAAKIQFVQACLEDSTSHYPRRSSLWCLEHIEPWRYRSTVRRPRQPLWS